MALNPNAVPYSREQVATWLGETTATDEAALRTFLEGKLGADAQMMVNTTQMNAWPDFTLLIDMIIADLPSYGFTYG